MSLEAIEKLCRALDEARGILQTRVQDLQDELDAAHKRHLKGIKQAVKKAAEAEAELRAAVEGAPELFEKPKTRVFHGIKVGYRKGAGKLIWQDAKAVVARIKKCFADQVDVLIKTDEKPIRDALKLLDVKDLARLGIAVEGTGDVVEVRPVDGEVDKLVKALLEHAVEEATEEDAA